MDVRLRPRYTSNVGSILATLGQYYCYIDPRCLAVGAKTENLSLVDLTRSRNVTHLIAEVSVLESSHAHGWTPVALIGGFDGWRFHGKYGLRAALAEGLSGLGNILEMRSGKLVILARKGKA